MTPRPGTVTPGTAEHRPPGEDDGEVRRRPNRPSKLSELLARDITIDIVRRRARPGETLPSEAVMLKRFGVGRASLREALRILEVQGIVTIRPGPGGGPVVAPHDPAGFARMMTLHLQVREVTYRELLQARRALEPTMARLAAERVDDSITAELRQNVALARSLPSDHFAEVADVWADFHALIGAASGNGVLDLLALGLQEVYRERVLYRERLAGRMLTPEAKALSDDDHEAIARAIMTGKGARAAKLMEAHMARIADDAEHRNPSLLSEGIIWE